MDLAACVQVGVEAEAPSCRGARTPVAPNNCRQYALAPTVGGQQLELRRDRGVRRREPDVEEEEPALVRRLRWPDDAGAQRVEARRVVPGHEH